MPDNNSTVTVLLCGVGGQGTILAADLLARSAIASGLEVKLSEIHGMAQRGGAVTTVVRFGKQVSSMVTDVGSADAIIAFETTEALRNEPFLKEKGTLFVNDESIKPLPVLTGKASMPENARERLVANGAKLIPASALAEQAGSAKAANVVLLGALASELEIDTDIWEEQISLRVPEKFVAANIEAFRLGYRFLREDDGRMKSVTLSPQLL